MRFVAIVFLLAVASAFITKYDNIEVNEASFIFRNFFMFDKETSPKISDPGNGESYIISSFTVSKIDATQPANGNIESLIVSKHFFDNIGYLDKGDDGRQYQIVCCDDKAALEKGCAPGTLILPKGLEGEFNYTSVKFNGETKTLDLHYNIPTTGQYLMVVGICDAQPKNILLQGSTIAMNPYGHLPGAHYGKLPFEGYLVVIYAVLIFLWFIRCFYYRTEMMSIQYIVSMVLVIFAIENLFDYINLMNYNQVGELDYTMNMIGLIISTLTRTLSRILTLEISMGLGISKPSIGNTVYKIYLLAIVFFVLSFWESYASTFSPNYDISYWRVIPASIVDAIWYFWIVVSLLDTLQELEDKKQTAKLSIFLKFRNLIIVALIVSSIYTIIFGYLFIDESVEIDWKYQWFYNEGIWNLFYLLILIYMLTLWAPNENSSAYAYHMQISTDERQDAEEYAMQDPLQADSSNVAIKITTVSQDELKPMKIKEASV